MNTPVSKDEILHEVISRLLNGTMPLKTAKTILKITKELSDDAQPAGYKISHLIEEPEKEEKKPDKPKPVKVIKKKDIPPTPFIKGEKRGYKKRQTTGGCYIKIYKSAGLIVLSNELQQQLNIAGGDKVTITIDHTYLGKHEIIKGDSPDAKVAFQNKANLSFCNTKLISYLLDDERIKSKLTGSPSCITIPVNPDNELMMEDLQITFKKPAAEKNTEPPKQKPTKEPKLKPTKAHKPKAVKEPKQPVNKQHQKRVLFETLKDEIDPEHEETEYEKTLRQIQERTEKLSKAANKK
jgi:hypothetical protein